MEDMPVNNYRRRYNHANRYETTIIGLLEGMRAQEQDRAERAEQERAEQHEQAEQHDQAVARNPEGTTRAIRLLQRPPSALKQHFLSITHLITAFMFVLALDSFGTTLSPAYFNWVLANCASALLPFLIVFLHVHVLAVALLLVIPRRLMFTDYIEDGSRWIIKTNTTGWEIVMAPEMAYIPLIFRDIERRAKKAAIKLLDMLAPVECGQHLCCTPEIVASSEQ
ncbi:uncharacterized protein K452DRAFT_294086 [Aplosporella prunicola CBS 121167]|uniref:Uncharacterized protein n=1 Tax=Aplosporella prunicola CBS 121167 TaxID=1176127 RepID=A0A6A6BR86_9PEZI|nr:uncharacterized protein K452DRAFT_294086 [Aplosporella prunicola CBS 121167]KAF2146520.1 hypothetical protein K452DRAFT_294086 [Aplosporella prunicola CBS 121167]